MVLVEQVKAMMDFLEKEPEIAHAQLNRTAEGRNISKQRWQECAKTLNRISVGCPTKTAKEWRMFFNDYKCKVLKKIKIHKQIISSGSTRNPPKLTPLQKRFYYDILEKDISRPIKLESSPSQSPTTEPHIEETIIIACDQKSNNEQQSQEQLISQKSNRQKLSLLQSNNQQTSHERQITQQTSHRQLSPQKISCNQPTHQVAGHEQLLHQPKRRFLRLAKLHPAETLEAAQARRERIEGRNAEASLERAKATNNLAGAIDRLGVTMEQATSQLAVAIERIADVINLFVPDSKRQQSEETDSD